MSKCQEVRKVIYIQVFKRISEWLLKEATTWNQLTSCHKNHEEEQDHPHNQCIITKIPLNYTCQWQGHDRSLPKQHNQNLCYVNSENCEMQINIGIYNNLRNQREKEAKKTHKIPLTVFSLSPFISTQNLSYFHWQQTGYS